MPKSTSAFTNNMESFVSRMFTVARVSRAQKGSNVSGPLFNLRYGVAGPAENDTKEESRPLQPSRTDYLSFTTRNTWTFCNSCS